MKKIILLLFAFVLTITAFVSTPLHALELDPTKDFSDKKITFLGDSLTAGSAFDEEFRWTYLVYEELGFGEYVNMGIGGSMVTDTVGRSDSFQDRVAQVPTDSDYVVIMGGWNDFGNNIPIADFQSAYEYVIDYLRTNIPSAEIIVATYFDNGNTDTNTEILAISDYNDVVKVVADDHLSVDASVSGKIQLLDMYSLADVTIPEVDEYTYDGLHPSIKGHRIVANMVESFLAGKNIDNTSSYINGILLNTGTYNLSLTDYYTTGAIKVTPGESYVLYNNGASTNLSYGVLMSNTGSYFDSDGNFLEAIVSTDNTNLVTTAPVNADYMIANIYGEQLDNFFIRHLVNKFIVSFDTTYDPLYVENEAIAEPAVPTKEGYTFDGWYTDQDYTTEYDFTTLVEDNINLYAKWVSDDTTPIPVVSVLTPPAETLSLWGIAWYWYAVAAVGVYYFGFTKKGRKTIGLK